MHAGRQEMMIRIGYKLFDSLSCLSSMLPC